MLCALTVDHVQVRPKPASAEELSSAIAECIAAENGASGIVYCLTRKETEQLTLDLQAAGISCGTYHADMDPVMRMEVHRSWTAGKVADRSACCCLLCSNQVCSAQCCGNA